MDFINFRFIFDMKLARGRYSCRYNSNMSISLGMLLLTVKIMLDLDSTAQRPHMSNFTDSLMLTIHSKIINSELSPRAEKGTA